MKQKIWYTYDDIHRVIKNLAEKIRAAGIKYDAMIAIGGGGFIPARMLRCFLEIPIYAVTTAYYDSDNEGQVTEEIKKVQWLDPVPEVLEGKNVLVVDEVDDSRITMEFCLNEFFEREIQHRRRSRPSRENQGEDRQNPRRHPLFQRPYRRRLMDKLSVGRRKHRRTQPFGGRKQTLIPVRSQQRHSAVSDGLPNVFMPSESGIIF